MSNQGISLPRPEKHQPHRGAANRATLSCLCQMILPEPAGNVCSFFKDNFANFFPKILKHLKKDSIVKMSEHGELLS